MSNADPISQAWKAHRAYLLDLAFRMLGDIGAAEDVVQEAFVRLLKAPAGEIDDERGWLIVVTSRLCLDQIRSAAWRRERPEDMAARDYAFSVDPADRVTLDDEVRMALHLVLERLTPAERVVFVLHDVFQVPFDVIATTVGRPSPACRQLARRARRKIEDAPARLAAVEGAEDHVITTTFIAACASGDFEQLVSVLDPTVSGEVDTREGVVVVGADKVARNLLHFWSRPDTVLVSQPIADHPALLAFVNRKLVGVLDLTIDGGKVTEVHVHVKR